MAKKKIAFFEKYLTIWVALCIVAGIAIGYFAGDKIKFLTEMEIFNVNIPGAILFG
jgi:ACR3 family arsenite transporter